MNPDGDVLSEVYYEINAEGMIGELTADPDGLIYPVVLNQYADGSREWLTLSEVGLYADLPFLQYDLVPSSRERTLRGIGRLRLLGRFLIADRDRHAALMLRY